MLIGQEWLSFSAVVVGGSMPDRFILPLHPWRSHFTHIALYKCGWLLWCKVLMASAVERRSILLCFLLSQGSRGSGVEAKGETLSRVAKVPSSSWWSLSKHHFGSCVCGWMRNYYKALYKWTIYQLSLKASCSGVTAASRWWCLVVCDHV